jgi:hypothetical protein
MTAQIVILNKLCAVVASDSAVTLNMGDGRQRSFPTADKIFSLPDQHRIAIVHSGGTDFLGAPYSVLLSEWARSLPDAPLETVGDYFHNWSEWLGAQHTLFSDTAQTEFFKWMLRDYFLAVRQQLLSRCQEAGLGADEWSSDQADALITDVLDASLNYLKSQPPMPGWEDAEVDDYLKANESLVREVREWVFDDTPRSPEGDNLLGALAKQLLLVVEPFSRDAILVFVGFGNSQWFPAAQKGLFQGLLGDRLRAGPPDKTEISMDMNASIIPLAQTEAVHTFLDAYNTSFLNEAHKRLSATIEQAKAIFPESAEQLDKLLAEAHQELDSDFQQLSWGTFVEPMINTVASLPPADLARMAESLVGLQVLRELTQAEAETVGGPIDVAMLTRSSGLRWVRHKSVGITGTNPNPS